MKINKTFGVFLSFLPGVAHMYMGLQRQGIELMTLFFLPMFLTDFIRISLFMFAVPIIWFYSFFDALHKLSDPEKRIDGDILLFSWLKGEVTTSWNKNKLLAYGLIFIGCVLIFQRVALPLVSTYISWGIARYLETAVLAILFILGGIKLLLGSKNSSKGGNESCDNGE